MKEYMKKYLQGIGIIIVALPFVVMGIVSMSTGMVLKSAGYALFGDFDHAMEELKQMRLL